MSTSKPSDGVCESVVDAIGATPLVNLARVSNPSYGRIVAKLEFLNPGLSKKDRAARQIIIEARENGELADGQPVVELTSGNMGTGLAIVCSALGHPFIAVMSCGNSEERARMMRALGAEVVLVRQAPGGEPGRVSGADLALVNDAAQRITRERGAFRADQFGREGNARSHYLGTACEIYEQLEGRIDAFCDFVGSGGTFAGCARYFKEKNPDIQCFIVEPEGAEALAGNAITCADHPVQGGGYSMTELALLEEIEADGFVSVSADEAIAAARRLAAEEGIFAGYSSGANLAAALKIQSRLAPGSTIAIVMCDSGLKYLTTDLWP